jgi:hypothetical protein
MTYHQRTIRVRSSSSSTASSSTSGHSLVIISPGFLVLGPRAAVIGSVLVALLVVAWLAAVGRDALERWRRR